TARGGRTRFMAMLDLGRALAGGKTAAVADGLFEGLVRTIDETSLEAWEPELALACYRAYFDCLKQLDKPNEPGLAERRAMVYRRVCRLDPVAASKQV
ncbi:MAG: type VI secretion system domain-containing protein, partial [Sandaracinaceae bacterium]|nr:type VI secretion system domain-containing protein [Sandaracinaceae bacterium]